MGPSVFSGNDQELLFARLATHRDAIASPPLFMAFDLLYRDGRDLTALAAA